MCSQGLHPDSVFSLQATPRGLREAQVWVGSFLEEGRVEPGLWVAPQCPVAHSGGDCRPTEAGAAGSLIGSHCSEHLLCAGEGASETAFPEVGRGCEASRPSRASVPWQHSLSPQSLAGLWDRARLHPEVSHREVKTVTKNDMCV